ncbi:type II toxin-antitoxin system RelE/ParE family toxin [Caldilinea sp.]|uniref:type II toxin-antitoxin system RelE family toxin n=1 Tax=Caldilinea sp. TaxID=2293560 RepID=UPI0021DC8CC0|nr:type II toxin-antitoxin system RelE/ParE family toxin [Caldilinea sp.]GIV67817.1 MAG: hypothetical protein KatS3mg048_0679 [Caldilinea sp.]
MKRYEIYVTPSAWAELQQLPGNVKQRLRKAIDGLTEHPTPPASKRLTYTSSSKVLLYRLRIDRWRVVYAIDEEAAWVGILAVWRRPPYDYSDLEALPENLL